MHEATEVAHEDVAGSKQLLVLRLDLGGNPDLLHPLLKTMNSRLNDAFDHLRLACHFQEEMTVGDGG